MMFQLKLSNIVPSEGSVEGVFLIAPLWQTAASHPHVGLLRFSFFNNIMP